MTAEVTLDRAGRVMLPKQLRRDLHLGPGEVADGTTQGTDYQKDSSSGIRRRGPGGVDTILWDSDSKGPE